MPDRTTRLRRLTFDQQRQLCTTVIDAYQQLLDLPPLAALQFAHDELRPRLYSGAAIDYKLDIERATESALREPAAQAAWFALLQGQPVDPDVETRVVTKCARLYHKRGLHPRRYFKPNRHIGAGRRLI